MVQTFQPRKLYLWGNLKIAVDHKVPDKTLIRERLLTLFERGPAQER